MKIIDVLRKLGILRYGTYKGTYKNKVPDQMLFDDVYDPDKDLVGGNKKKVSKGDKTGK